VGAEEERNASGGKLSLTGVAKSTTLESKKFRDTKGNLSIQG